MLPKYIKEELEFLSAGFDVRSEHDLCLNNLLFLVHYFALVQLSFLNFVLQLFYDLAGCFFESADLMPAMPFGEDTLSANLPRSTIKAVVDKWLSVL